MGRNSGEGTFVERLREMGGAFGLQNIDLVVSQNSGKTVLKIELQHIDVTGMTEREVINELIGYLFVNRYCRSLRGGRNSLWDAESYVRRTWGTSSM